jgi:hypothetical protein
MLHESIRFLGTYRYTSRDVLDRALADAREHVEEEELHEWMRFLVASGATLRIDAALPHDGDRFAAVAVLEVLARDAIDGVVEARRGTLRLDTFPSGDDD